MRKYITNYREKDRKEQKEMSERIKKNDNDEIKKANENNTKASVGGANIQMKTKVKTQYEPLPDSTLV